MNTALLKEFPMLDVIAGNVIHCDVDNTINKVVDDVWYSIGTNRATADKKCQIAAKNDIEATLCWLREYEHKPNTHRVYKKAAELLHLICKYKLKKPLSSLNRDDFEIISDFLSDPEPRDFWCSGKKVRRDHPDWRPLRAPLSDSAKRTTLLAIKSLMDYLVEARYLEANPMGLIKDKFKKSFNKSGKNPNDPQHAAEMQLGLSNKILEQDEWDALIDTLNEMSEDTEAEKNKKARLRFIVSILGYLGLRINELATHHWNAFFKKVFKENETWWMLVYGKGDKLRTAAVNNCFLTELIRYRRHFGLTAFPDKEDKRPILVNIRGDKYSFTGLSTKRIRNLVKELVIKAAEKFADKPSKAQKLRNFSPHSFRHTCASMQYYAGVNPQHTKENLGHSSLEMTAYYQHSLDKLRHEDMMKFKLRVR
jgi:integrase